MKGILKALSGVGYGLFNEDGDRVFHFKIVDPNERKKIDHLQMTEVDYDEDILTVLSEDAVIGSDVDIVQEEEEVGEEEVKETDVKEEEEE